MSLDSNTAFNIAPHNTVLMPQKVSPHEVILTANDALKYARRLAPGGSERAATAGKAQALGTLTFLPSDLEKTQWARDRRFQLQHAIQSILQMKRHDRNFIDKTTGGRFVRTVRFRVVSCLHNVRAGEKAVKVRKTSQGATYANIQVCGSVWHCPVCAAKITNERRSEINQTIIAARARGLKAIMVTLTARHHAYNQLDDQLGAMLQASDYLWSGGAIEKFKKRFGFFGRITALECTWHPRNGWHPHYHVLVFVPESVVLADFSEALRPLWEAACGNAGLTLNRHGFKATDTSTKIEKYVAKFGYDPSEETLAGWAAGKWWGDADELARWFTKSGDEMSSKGFTPWQIAEMFMLTGDHTYSKLFVEYARAFHNKQQLGYSVKVIDGKRVGLRKELGLSKALSDQEAAEKQQEAVHLLDVVIAIPDFQRVSFWRSVTHGDIPRDGRAVLLSIIESNDTSEEIGQAIFDTFGFRPLVMMAPVAQDDGGGTGESPE